MKKTMLLLSLLLSTAAVAQAAVVEAVVARVGDRIITRSDYLTRLDSGLRDLEQTVPPEQLASEQEKFRDELLNEMIAELLIKDRADRIGITVTQQEIDEAIERLKTQYGISSEEEFVSSLQQSGITRSEMEDRLRDQMLTSKVFSRELRARADLSDTELRRRYEQEKERYRRPQRAHVREIVIVPLDVADAASFEAARLEAEQVITRARAAGADFAAIATEVSDSPTREKGGDLGIIAQGELIPSLDQAVFNAQAGTVVGPIQTRAGWHVLLVEERLPSDIPGFDEVKERLRAEASDAAFQRDYKLYIESLRAQAFLQIREENLPN